MAVVGAQGAEYVESDEMLLRVCSDKEPSLAKVVEAAACDAASGTYTDDQGRLALHHACANESVTVEILAATPGDRFAKDISGDAPVDLLCRNPAATAAAHARQAEQNSLYGRIRTQVRRTSAGFGFSARLNRDLRKGCIARAGSLQ